MKLRFRSERGFAAFEALAGMALSTVIAAGLTLGVVNDIDAVRNYMTIQSAWGAAMGLEDRLRSEAAASLAVFTPGQDVQGNANCAGGTCHELDFYTKDAQRRPHFWAYLYTNGSAQRYVYTSVDGSGNPQGAQPDGSPTTLTSFSARIVQVNQFTGDPDVSPLTKQIITQQALSPASFAFNFGYAGISGGNYIAIVKLANAQVSDTLSLSTRTEPTIAEMVTNGIYAPTPPPPVQVDQNSVTIQLPSTNATVNSHEDYYHNIFNESDSCGGIASISPGSEYPNPNPMSPPGQNSGWAPWQVSPESAGSCTFTISDVYGQSQSVGVNVLPAPTPTPTGGGSGSGGSGSGGGGNPTPGPGGQTYYIDTCPAAQSGTYEYTDGSGNVYLADGNASAGCSSTPPPPTATPDPPEPSPNPFCNGKGQDGLGYFYWIAFPDGTGASAYGWIMDPLCQNGFVFAIETGSNCTDLSPCPTIAVLTTTNNGVSYNPTNVAAIMQGFDNQTGAVGVDFRSGMPWLVCQNLANNAGSVESVWLQSAAWEVPMFRQMYMDALGTADSNVNCGGVLGGGL